MESLRLDPDRVRSRGLAAALGDQLGPPAGGGPRVATLGVFDGVHRGHVEMFRETVDRARDVGGVATCFTFDRHPLQVLTGRSPRMLTNVAHRLLLLERAGLDAAVVVPFIEPVAETEAEAFLVDGLLEAAGVRHLVLGEDAGFGKERRGDVAFCRARAEDPAHEPPFTLRVVPHVTLPDGAKVSSTIVREALASGRLEEVERLLGRPHALYGRVVEGDRRGRRIGFPTANLDPGGELLPPRGVYGGVARVDDGEVPALVNVGRRPTFGGDEVDRAEVHLVDWSGDLYGEWLEVALLEPIRGERSFPGPEALATRIEEDRRVLLEEILPGREEGEAAAAFAAPVARKTPDTYS